MTGKISRILADKNFGFITGEDGNDYFFHKSSLVNENSFNQGLIGKSVEFEDGQSTKGLRAESVFVE